MTLVDGLKRTEDTVPYLSKQIGKPIVVDNISMNGNYDYARVVGFVDGMEIYAYFPGAEPCITTGAIKVIEPTGEIGVDNCKEIEETGDSASLNQKGTQNKPRQIGGKGSGFLPKKPTVAHNNQTKV